MKILSKFKMNKIIYPGVITRHTGLDMTEVYIILDEIENLNVIEKAYEVYCPRCQGRYDEIYYSLSDVPDDFFCESCENEFNFLNGLLIIYRVIAE